MIALPKGILRPAVLMFAAVSAAFFLFVYSQSALARAANDAAGKTEVSPLDQLLGGGAPPNGANKRPPSHARPKSLGRLLGWSQPATESSRTATQDPATKKPQQDPQEASGNTEDVLEKKGEEKPDPAPKKAESLNDNAPSLMKKALSLEKNGHYPSALQSYRLALGKASSSGDRKRTAAARSGMARVLNKLGHEEEALKELRHSIKMHRELKNAQARSLDFLLAGRILFGKSRYGTALKYFEESIKILPASEAAEKPRLLEDTASCQIRLHRYTQALSTYGRLLSLFNKQKDPLQAARIHVMIGELEVSRSDYKSARVNFKKAETIYRKHKRPTQLGETLFRKAYLDQVAGNLTEAQKAVKQGQSLISNDTTPGAAGLPLLVRGLQASSEGKVILAVKNLSEALNHYEKAGNRLMAGRSRLALANVEKDRSRLTAALELGGLALNEFRSMSDLGGEAGALRLIGNVYYLQGFVQKSLEYAQESLAIARKIRDRNRMARSRVLLAKIHAGLGDTDFAWKLLKEAAEDSRGGINPRTKGMVRLAEARFLVRREMLQKSLQKVGAARKAFAGIRDRRGMADCDNLMGKIYELRGDREKASALLKRALDKHRAMWDRLGEGKDLTALGVHYKNMGEYGKALDYFGKALDLRKGMGDRKGVAANLANMGNVLKHKGKMSDAQTSLEEALKIYKELSDKRGEADMLTNLGNLLAARGSYDTALERFSGALTLHREIQDYRGMATDLAGMGRLQLAKGDMENAEIHLRDAAKVNQRIHNPRGQVAILAEIAMLERAKRNIPRAQALLKQALELAEKFHDAKAVSSVYLKMATVYQDANNLGEALALLKKAVTMMSAQGDRRGELWALAAMGTIQVKTEDYESALANLHQAVKIRSDLGLSSSDYLELDFHLGEIYEGFRDFEKALDHYHKALAMAQIAGTDSLLGKTQDRIGNIYYRMEEYDKAREFLEDALRVHSVTNNNAMQQSELIRLGDIFSKLGDNRAAVKKQVKALALSQETQDVQTEARILTRLGTLYQILGRPRVALDYYRKAKDKRTELGDRRGVNENLLQIALVTSILGNFQSAVSDLKKAFEIAQCSEDRSMLWKAYFIMGRALQGKRRLGEALESYRKAITVLEAMEADIAEESDEDNFIFGGKTALFETTLRVLMKLARKDPDGAYDNQALRILEKLKAASFENTLSRINVENFSDLPQELLIKEKSLKLGLKRLNARIAAELSKVNPDQSLIARLLKERRAREKLFTELKDRLLKDYPAYSKLRYPKPVSVHRLQKDIIDPDEAILQYMVTRSRTHVFAIDKQRFFTYSVAYARTDLEKDVETITRPLHRAETQASWDPSVAYRLYSRIIKPVESFLKGKKTVTIIPHGPLSSLPFEILVTSKKHAGKRFWTSKDQPTYLLERYAICYAPSAAVLSHVRTRERREKPGWSVVAFGEAVYSDPENKKELNEGVEKRLASVTSSTSGDQKGSLKPLRRARREITEISRMVDGPVQTYFGLEASETLFKKADLSRYSYVHLATRGALLPGGGKLWKQPAIVFSLYGDQENDGFLELGEVFGLKLNSDLVVLSSSLSSDDRPNTNTDSLMGLARALLFSGSDSVVLGMWPEKDSTTIQVFTQFYSHLKTCSKAEALRRAKLALVKNQGTGHPYFWAPFVLIGDWRVAADHEIKTVDPGRMRFKGLSTWRRLLSM